MSEYLLAGEVLVGVLLTVVFCFVAWIYGRRLLINHGGDVMLAAMRLPGSTRWRLGVARISADSLDWFPAVGLTTRPAQSWGRSGLELGAVTPAAALPWRSASGGSLVVRITGPAARSGEVRVTQARAQAHEADLALGPGPYTAIRSWAEARPPSTLPYQA